MGVLLVVEGFDKNQQQNQLSSRLRSDRSSLTTAAASLDAALRLWDQDRCRAKSQVKAAAVMLRDLADYHACEALPPASTPGKCGLALWQACKVAKFIDASLTSRIRLGDCASQISRGP
jgi:hypothetical protein